MEQLNNLMNIIDRDEFKEKMGEGTYLECCNILRDLYRQYPSQPDSHLPRGSDDFSQETFTHILDMFQCANTHLTENQGFVFHIAESPLLSQYLVENLTNFFNDQWKPSYLKKDAYEHHLRLILAGASSRDDDILDFTPYLRMPPLSPAVESMITGRLPRILANIYEHYLNRLDAVLKAKLMVIQNGESNEETIRRSFETDVARFAQYGAKKMESTGCSHKVKFNLHRPHRREISIESKTPYWVLHAVSKSHLYFTTLTKLIINEFLNDYTCPNVKVYFWKSLVLIGYYTGLNINESHPHTFVHLKKGGVGASARKDDKRTYFMSLTLGFTMSSFHDWTEEEQEIIRYDAERDHLPRIIAGVDFIKYFENQTFISVEYMNHSKVGEMDATAH